MTHGEESPRVIETPLHVERGSRDDHALQGSRNRYQSPCFKVLCGAHGEVRHRVPMNDVGVRAGLETKRTGRAHFGIDLGDGTVPSVMHRDVCILGGASWSDGGDTEAQSSNEEHPRHGEGCNKFLHSFFPSCAGRSDVDTSDSFVHYFCLSNVECRYKRGMDLIDSLERDASLMARTI